MRVIFINDCAFVARTLTPFLKERGVEVLLLERGVNPIDKTVKSALNCVKALLKLDKETIVHVNYAYQDAFVMGFLSYFRGRKIDVLHCHGSDVRWKQYGRTGFIVKFGLKRARKILVSTPDLIEHVETYLPEYLPNPIDVEMFKPQGTCPPRALYQWLWYEKLPPEIPQALKEAGIGLTILKSKKGTKARSMPIKWRDMPSFLNEFGIFISCFTIPFFTKTALESMACGLATIDYRHKDLKKRIEELSDPSFRVREGIRNRAYILMHHDARKITDQLVDIYESLLRR